jgi:hypothetical protein
MKPHHVLIIYKRIGATTRSYTFHGGHDGRTMRARSRYSTRLLAGAHNFAAIPLQNQGGRTLSFSQAGLAGPGAPDLTLTQDGTYR